jgi:hypothetical protein
MSCKLDGIKAKISKKTGVNVRDLATASEMTLDSLLNVTKSTDIQLGKLVNRLNNKRMSATIFKDGEWRKTTVVLKDLRVEDGVVKFGDNLKLGRDGIVGNLKVHSIKKLMDEVYSEQDKITANYIAQRNGLDVLASDEDRVQGKTYAKQAEELTNNPEKIKEFMAELRKKDTYELSDKHYAHLESIVDKFIGGLGQKIPEMTVWLNEEAKKNGGIVNLDDKKIKLNVGNAVSENDKSMPEIYVHELLHAVFEYANASKDGEVNRIIHELGKLRLSILGDLTVEDMIPSNATVRERKEAASLLKYMRNENYGLQEFSALVMTNEMVIEAVKNRDKRIVKTKKTKEYKQSRSTWEKFVDKVLELWDKAYGLVMGKDNVLSRKDGQRTAELLLRLSKLNDKAVRENRKGVMNKVGEMANQLDDKVGGVLAKWYKKQTDKTKDEIMKGELKIPVTAMEKLKFIGVNARRFSTSYEYRKVLRGVLNQVWLHPEGAIMTFFRHMGNPDNYGRWTENMINLSGHIDSQKELLNATYHTVMNNMLFTKDKRLREVATTVGLKLDIQSLNYSKSQLLEALDKDDRTRLINELKEGLPTNEVNDVKRLGYLMVTGKSLPGQVTYVDGLKWNRLATLYALEYTDEAEIGLFKELLETDYKGWANTEALHKAFVDESKEFIGKDKMLKGYVKTAYKKDVSLILVDHKDVKKMEKKGYKIERILKQSVADKRKNVNLVVMSSEMVTESRYNKAAARLTDHTKKGDKVPVNRFGKRRYIAEKEDYDPRTDEEMLYIDTETKEGVAMSYSYKIPGDLKEKLKQPDYRADQVISNMFRTIYDQKATQKFNKQIVEGIIADAEKNVPRDEKGRYTIRHYGQNNEMYVMFGPNSTLPDLQEAWSIMPTEFKEAVKKATYKGSGNLPIRRDLMHNLLGYRKWDASNAIPYMEHAKWAKKTGHFAETIWKEVVALAKVDIIIKTPTVLWSNNISNTAFGISQGINPIRMMRLQMDGVKYLHEYIKWHKELEMIIARQKTADGVSKRDERRLEVLRGNLKGSPIADMVDAGLYQAIVEDLGAYEANNKGHIETYLDKKLESVPGWVKTGAEYAYLSSNTLPFQMMQKATQYSDFAARYAVKEAMAEAGPSKEFKVRMNKDVWKREVIKSKEMISYDKWLAEKWKVHTMNKIVDSFINYSVPDSKLVQYANDIGLVMFTRYFMRIQKVIKQSSIEHPVHFVTMLLTQYAMEDIDTIDDQSLFVKDLSRSFYSPMTTLEHVLVPTMTEVL